MATYSLDDVMADSNAKKTYSLNEVIGNQLNTPKLTRADKYLKGVKDPLDAGAQLLTNILPNNIVNSVNQFNNFVADKTGLVRKLPQGGINQQIAQDDQLYQSQRAQQGETGFDGYRMIGNVVNPANIAIGARVPQAANLLSRVGIGALGGGISTGLTAPVLENTDHYWQEKAKQVATGAVFGGAVPALGSTGARIISPEASVNPQLALLKENGVNPTIGQTLGGWANKAEEKLQSLPIMGDMISYARQATNTDFAKATFNKALNPIGMSLPKGIEGRDAVVFTENALKTKYDDVLKNIGAIKTDSAFDSKVTSLKGMVTSLLIPKAEKAKFQSALNDLQASKDANGYITSDAYKTLESSLGTDASKLGASTNIYEGKLAPAIKQLQAELRDLLKRQAGTHADELSNANKGWANFKRVQNASSKLGADDGNFTPAQYQNAVRALDKSKDKSAFARGNALGQELGDAGKTVLTNKVPDSGTTGRAFLGLSALATGALNLAIPAGLIGGASLYTKPIQKLLTGSVSARPKLAAPAAKYLRKGSNYIAPSGGTIGLGLLNQ